MSYDYLSGAERRRLRQAIDRRARRRRGGWVATSCCGCDMPLDDLTPGCTACWDRHRSRVRRGANPERAAESQRLLAAMQDKATQWQIDQLRQGKRADNARRATKARR